MKRCLGFALFLALAACGGNPPPTTEPCQPVPSAAATFTWNSSTQLELSWVDMPVTVGGGKESCVFQRQLVIDLPQVRRVKSVSSFHGFDQGDSVESLTVLYALDGTKLYTRSEHLSGVGDNYDANDPPELVGVDTRRLTLDAVCRVTGNNGQTGKLSARCHFQVTVTFGDSTPPPPSGCGIAGPNDPKWRTLGQDRTTRKQLNAAKAVVGDRTGQDPLETLRLLAQAVRTAGGCAVGPWDDEVAILRSDGNTDGWHAVAFGTGGYTGTPKGDAWTLDSPPTVACSAPNPRGEPATFTLSKHNRLWDSTYKITSRAYCEAAGFPGRNTCPVRPEGHLERPACEEAAVGRQEWWCDGAPKDPKDGNRAQARCTGHVKTCNESGSTCAEADW